MSSYSTVADMSRSVSLQDRASAAVAQEVAGGTPGDSRFTSSWIGQRAWDLAATPGWGDKWESAVAGGVPDPGENPAVITDGDILSRIQALLVEYPLPDTPAGQV